MEIDVHKLLSENPVLLTFVVIGLGFILGRVRIAGVEVGSTAGVLVSGLLLGHLGFPDTPSAASFGFAIFIFAVGIQAGPSFFSAVKEDGLRYAALAVVVALTAFGLALGISRLLDLEAGLGAGLLAGALTSTPTLAGAQDAVQSGLANLPTGITPARAANNVGVGYAITYLFGTVGLIVLIRYFPRLMGVDLPAEAQKLARERGIGMRRSVTSRADRLPVVRAYRVGTEGTGKTLRQQRAEADDAFMPLRVRRGGQLLDPEPSLELEEGDLVSVVANVRRHADARERVGEEVLDPELLNFSIVTREIVISQSSVTRRPISELEMMEEFGCYAVGLRRASIELPVEAGTLLERGDRLRVMGEERRLGELAERLGYVEEEIEDSDLLTFSGGIVVGVLVGLVVLKLGGVSIGLGTAGGLLIAGITIGFVSSINPTFGRLPAPARNLLMELGLVLFMCGVGLGAGGGVWEALTAVGPAMILGGAVVTLAPVIVGYLVGHHVLKLNPALLLGSITGAMTSTPSLQVVSEVSRSSVPALGYAGTYTFANVLLTFAGTVLMMI